MIPPTLNGLRVVSVRLILLWRGAWVADCVLDPDLVASAPTSGPAALVVGGVSMVGTVDPRGSGSFVDKASARVVGGAGGWDRVVPAQDFASDTGVPSSLVYTSTGALVKEAVTDLAPSTFGAHFVRPSGPAAGVFGALDWWVDLTGVTFVGPRPPAVPDTSLTVTNFDPGQQRVEFTCDVPVTPNTTFVDPRFNGSLPVARDIEQVFDATGSRGVAWCAASASSRLLDALEGLCQRAVRLQLVRQYRYRLVLYQGTRMALQAVTPTEGVPDIVPLNPWAGLAGVQQTLAPSQEVIVAFDWSAVPPTPVSVAFSGDGTPLKTTLDASVEYAIGPSSALVALAGGLDAVALSTPLTVFLGALQTWSAAVAAALSSALFPIVAPQAALVDAIAAAQAATPAVKTRAT